MSDGLKTDIGKWIVRAALTGTSDLDILAGVCERLNEAGMSLVRAAIGADLLDPTFDSVGALWNRGRGATERISARTDDSDNNPEWLQSPFYRLVESGDSMLRRRLDATYERGEFPLLDEFQDQGVTDYAAFVQRIDESLRFGEFQGMVSSFTTDARDGFTDVQLETLAGIMPTAPLHQGWRASQSITSRASSCSCFVYSSSSTPSESPEPRMSTRTPA